MQSHFCKQILTKNKSLPWKLLDMFWFENKSRTATERFPTVDVIQQNYKAKSTMHFIVYVYYEVQMYTIQCIHKMNV